MRQDRQVRTATQVAGGNGYAVARDLSPKLVSIEGCKPLGRETRKHPPGQLRKLAASLDRFGFVLPIVIDPQQRVVAGWGLVLAARQLGLPEVPAVCLTDLPEAELRALRLALNRLTEDSAWDREALTIEVAEILELAPDISLEISGFEMGEIDALLDGDGIDQEDELPAIDDASTPVTRLGDLWHLGGHRIFCGDALEAESYVRVLSCACFCECNSQQPRTKMGKRDSGLASMERCEYDATASRNRQRGRKL